MKRLEQIPDKVVFKRGTHRLHKEPNFNFQLNRVVNWNGGRLEDVEQIVGNISTAEDWKNSLILLGNRAMEEERVQNAIGYYRMSEFFMYDKDSDKVKYYQLATELFYQYYQIYFQEREGGQLPLVRKYEVPFEDVKLPVLHVKPMEKAKGILLFHGGNDSYFEEFFFPMLYLREKGYEVYLFEGPGQGGVMRLQKKHFTYQWEKPVKAILDYFSLDGVTIIGLSLGGYLAPRAAAVDKRISKVVAWSVFPCFMDVLLGGKKKWVQKSFHFLMKVKAKWIINGIFDILSKKDPLIDWGLRHGMYAYQSDNAYDYAQKMKQYDIRPIGDMVNQDILIIGAKQDHFIDYCLVGKEIKWLQSVRSLTFRLITEKEDGEDHCNCGNCKLALDNILVWLSGLEKREE